MTTRESRIYSTVVWASALLIGIALLVWAQTDSTRGAVALGFLLLHMAATARDYRRGIIKW